MSADHLALALARPHGDAAVAIRDCGVEVLEWRDEIVRVLGRNEGGGWEREGRPATSVSESPAERRFTGELPAGADVGAVLALAADEAAVNGHEVGPAHLVVALLLAVDSVGAGTARWLGLTPGRVRAATGLVNRRRTLAGGASSGHLGPRQVGAGPLVLCGGASALVLPAVVELSPKACRMVLVDLAWSGPPPSAESRRRYLDTLLAAGAGAAVDSGLVDRDDASDALVCERLASADAIWCTGGSVAALYDRLWATPALDAIVYAHQSGALLGGVSAGATVWGAGVVSDYVVGDPEPLSLFGLLEDVVVFCHYLTSRECAFRERLRAFPGCRGLAVTHGGAIVVDDTDGPRPLCTDATGIAGAVLEDPDGPLATL